ncbi:MAG: polysaccharide deacetylase family protein [Candidatus Hodarchaeota archaeon]
MSQTTGGCAIKATKWKDNRKSVFSFSFDDGYVSQYTNARKILNKHGFKGTIFIVPNWTSEETGKSIYHERNMGIGSWPQFIEMFAEGHELASHTLNHQDLTTLEIGGKDQEGTLIQELEECKKIIEERTNAPCFTHGAPYGRENDTIKKITSEIFEFNRGVPSSISGYALILPVFDRQAKFDDMKFLRTYMRKVEKMIKKGHWTVLVTHEVLHFSKIELNKQFANITGTSIEWFSAFCDRIQALSDQKILWVDTIGHVARYIKERDNLDCKIVFQSDSTIDIALDTSLDHALYDYPLTLDITLPGGWKTVELRHTAKENLEFKYTNEEPTVIRVNVVPDGKVLCLNNNSLDL